MRRGIALAAIAALVVLALVGIVLSWTIEPESSGERSSADAASSEDEVDAVPRVSRDRAGENGPPAERRSRRCTLVVRLRSPDGGTTEGIGVEVDGKWGSTGPEGTVAFGELTSGRGYSVVVRSLAGPELARTEIGIPRGVERHTADIDVPKPMAVELLLRLRGAPARSANAEVVLALANVSTRVALPPGQDAWRFAMVLGSRAELTVQAPGYRPVAREVEAPRASGVHTVDVDLVASGLDTHGRVVDAEGEPVEGAWVMIFEDRDPGRRLHRAVTGEDGRFGVIPQYIEKPWVVRHQSRALCSDWFVPTEIDGRLEIVLHTGARVEGRLLDQAGNGVPLVYSAALRFGGGPDQRTWTFTEIVQADIDGSYVFGGLPEGWWVRPYAHRRHRGRPRSGSEDLDFGALDFEADRAAGRVHRTGGAGDVFRRDLELEGSPVVPCRVRLQFPDGVAYTGSARIELTTFGADPRSGGMGAIVSHVTPDDPVIAFGTSPGSDRMLRVRAGTWSGELGPVDLRSGQAEPFVVRLGATLRVMVQLVSETGAKLKQRGVRIGLLSHELPEGIDRLFRAATSESGRADISSFVPESDNWPDGGIRLLVDGVERLHLRERPAAGEDGIVVLRVPAPPRRRITIRTIDPAGVPVAGVPWSASTGWVLASERGRTDDVGESAVEVLRDPHWRRFELEADSPFMGETTFDDESLRAADTWTLVVSRLPEYDVIVLDEEGRPVPGARIAGESTDAAGRARIHGKPGARIGAYSPTHAIVDQTLPASNDAPVELLARALRSLRVLVKSSAEVPAGTKLELVLECLGDPRVDGTIRRFASAADGQPVEIATSVVAEPYRLTVRHARGVWAGTVDVAGDAVATEIEVGRATTHGVRLRLEDAAGNPLPGREVSIRVGYVPWLDDVRRTTDSDGTFSIDVPDWDKTFRVGFRLDPGDFRYVTAPRPRDAKEPVPLRLPDDRR